MGNTLSGLKQYLGQYRQRPGRAKRYPFGIGGILGETLLAAFGSAEAAVDVLSGAYEQVVMELQAYSTSPQQISTHPRSASQDSTSRLPASASLQTSHNPLYEDDTSRVPDWAATDAQDHPTDSPVISTRSHSNAPSISQTTSPSNTTFSRSPTPRSAQPSDLTSLHSNPLAHEDPHARDTDHPARYPPSPQDLDQRPQSARSDLTHHNTRPRSAERFSQNLPRGSGERDSFSGSSLSSFASGTSDREHYSALQTTPLQQAVGAEQVQDGFGQVRRRVETQESVKDPSHHASNPQTQGPRSQQPSTPFAFDRLQRLNVPGSDFEAGSGFSLRSSSLQTGSPGTRRIPISRSPGNIPHTPPDFLAVPSWSATRAGSNMSLRRSQELAGTQSHTERPPPPARQPSWGSTKSGRTNGGTLSGRTANMPQPPATPDMPHPPPPNYMARMPSMNEPVDGQGDRDATEVHTNALYESPTSLPTSAISTVKEPPPMPAMPHMPDAPKMPTFPRTFSQKMAEE